MKGKGVKAGEPLFYINDRTYKAKVEKAKAKLKRDEAQALKAESDLKRNRTFI
jgi:HlyD family secretion protein.